MRRASYLRMFANSRYFNTTFVFIFCTAYDILAEDLAKPERPEIVPATIYPDVAITEILDFDTIVANVVTNELKI